MEYKTFISQEFLKQGYLAGTAFYGSSSHSTQNIDEYANILDKIYKEFSLCENGKNINNLLEGPICHTGFRRLN